MSIITHLETLMIKHAKLEKEVNEAYSMHLPDYMVHELKKQKLKVKEAITQLQKKLNVTQKTNSKRLAA